MTNDSGPSKPAWFGLVLFGVVAPTLLFGLCTIFAGVVIAAQPWQEHAQEHWPEVTARARRRESKVFRPHQQK